MGGHGLYVWLAYGSAVVVVIANIASVRLAWRRHMRHFDSRLRARRSREEVV